VCRACASASTGTTGAGARAQPHAHPAHRQSLTALGARRRCSLLSGARAAAQQPRVRACGRAASAGQRRRARLGAGVSTRGRAAAGPAGARARGGRRWGPHGAGARGPGTAGAAAAAARGPCRTQHPVKAPTRRAACLRPHARRRARRRASAGPHVSPAPRPSMVGCKHGCNTAAAAWALPYGRCREAHRRACSWRTKVENSEICCANCALAPVSRSRSMSSSQSRNSAGRPLMWRCSSGCVALFR